METMGLVDTIEPPNPKHRPVTRRDPTPRPPATRDARKPDEMDQGIFPTLGSQVLKNCTVGEELGAWLLEKHRAAWRWLGWGLGVGLVGFCLWYWLVD